MTKKRLEIKNIDFDYGEFNETRLSFTLDGGEEFSFYLDGSEYLKDKAPEGNLVETEESLRNRLLVALGENQLDVDLISLGTMSNSKYKAFFRSLKTEEEGEKISFTGSKIFSKEFVEKHTLPEVQTEILNSIIGALS